MKFCMIDRQHIEAILKTNGIPPTADDEKIKSILLQAKYSADEVDAAVMVLRENTNTNKTKVYGLHKIFRTDQTLTPEEITSLLGIDVELDEIEPAKKRRVSANNSFSLAIFVFSLLLAGIMLFLYMYVAEVGVFHITKTNIV